MVFSSTRAAGSAEIIAFEPLERQATLPLADPVGLVAGLPQLEPRTSRSSRISRSHSLNQKDKDGQAVGQGRRGSDIPEADLDEDEKKRERDVEAPDARSSTDEPEVGLVRDVPPNGGAKAWTVVFGMLPHFFR